MPDDGLTAFERRRAENAKANNAILSSISKTSAKVFGAAAKPARAPRARSTKNSTTGSAAPATSTRSRRSHSAAAVAPVKRESPMPTRRSARVAGIEADADSSSSQKRKGGELDGLRYDLNAVAAAERQKRQRVHGDLQLSDMQVDGRWQGSLDGLGSLARGAQPGVRTFTDADETTDADLKAIRLELGRLELYDKFAVKGEFVDPFFSSPFADFLDLKLTKDRIYAMAFHPTEDKPLVFAGDKEGRLGIFDASQEPDVAVKEEDVGSDDEAEAAEPVILGFKPHARTISAVHVLDSDPGSVYTASYDTTIRRLDLAAQKSVEVYVSDGADDAAISCIDFAADDPHLVYFATLSGLLGRHDLRLAPTTADRWPRLHDGHKIGGFSLSPRQPHLIATASLDRTLRVWDLRKMVTSEDEDGTTKLRPALLATDPARLSVSHAAWSPGGHVATTSYDDTVRIYDVAGAASWAPGKALDDDVLTPAHRIAHNNQTGRWVTILKPQWQRRPPGGIDKFALGNMNRFVDVYAASGEQLAQLDGDGITAVPAVAQLHPSRNWVAGGNGSGKLTLWM
ncbi:WD domain containing protein [Grosmannia clavigera kw1407]|uniref:DNA damage-binding protein CMR1 n=1 Tax=Grosmannia clavigera (strain kw1407 / UAMH 11150) TaxID=655863 RepID=F0XEW7_GROCL|nr:WD domain containing protein [Grosmannia clavigera kw1407]EFX03540.1 WD domain containing protein [Grosmannia clavigera kw1407]